MIVSRIIPGAQVDAGESVSGKVSDELAWDGALAIGFAMIGIAIYIWFRFEWQFGVGALVTLFHDVSMMLGFFALTQLQVDLNVVAAFLTIVGYSLNDTVVIYDRIRENLRKYRKMAIVPLLNLSLNETLSRTMVTSLSILLALAVLLLLGPEVMFGLTIAIFLGTFIGTYSSIYISSPVLVWLGVKPDSFLEADEDKARRSRSRLTPFIGAPSKLRPMSAWPCPGATLRRSSWSNNDPYRGAVACCRDRPSRRRLRPQQGQGRHRLRRPRRQHALQPRQGAARPAAITRRPPSCSTRSSASIPIRSGPAARS